MEGVRDGQLTRLDTGRGQLVGNRQHGFPLTGNDHTFGAVDGSNRHFLGISSNRRLDLGLRRHQRGHRPILRQRAHQPPTRRHQFQAVFQAEDPRHASRRQLANTMTDEQVWLNPPALPQRRQRIFQGKERRLGVGGIIQCDA